MILVTGGTGLVGSYITLKLLKEGEKVRLTYRTEASKFNVLSLLKIYKSDQAESLFATIDWVQADLLDIFSLEDALKDIDYVYHCAGKVSFAEKDKNQLFETNIEGTENLLNICIDKKSIKKLCYISSIAVLDSELDQPITEESTWLTKKYHSSYAGSKYGAELAVWRASQEGLKTIILNPSVVVGSTPTEDNISNIDKLRKTKYYLEGSIIPLVDAEDVANVAYSLMDKGIDAERFIINSDDVSFKDILSSAGTFAKSITKSKLKLAYYINKVLPIFGELNRNVVDTLLHPNYYSSNKIKEILPGYQFKDFSKFIPFHINNIKKL